MLRQQVSETLGSDRRRRSAEKYICMRTALSDASPLTIYPILFHPRRNLLIHTLSIEFVLLEAALQPDQTHRRHRTRRSSSPASAAFSDKDVTYSTAQTADHRMLLNSHNLAGLLCSLYDQLLIQRFDCMDIDNLRINAICCQLFSRFQCRDLHKDL